MFLFNYLFHTQGLKDKVKGDEQTSVISSYIKAPLVDRIRAMGLVAFWFARVAPLRLEVG